MMKLGKFLGIDVSLHWTLLLLVLWTASTSTLLGFLPMATLMVAMFGCVLLHEFGHALAARQFGIHTAGIALYPIGGVASLERMPRDPKQELWIAVAGPLVNVVIAGGLFLLLTLVSLAVGEPAQVWLTNLLIANIGLVVFNLLPAFPMDGGRIFRSLSAMFTDYQTATRWAASLGKVMAIALGLLGIVYGHLILILIAGFVFLAGSAEAAAVASDSAAGHPAIFSPMRNGYNPSQSHWVQALRNGRRVTAVWDEHRQAYLVVSH